MVDFGDESNQDIKINVDIVGAEQSAAKLDAMADALDGVAGATNKQAAELEKIAEKAIRAADSVEKAAEKIQKIKSNATPQETASFDEALERRRLAVSAEREAAAERAAEQEKLAAGQAAKAVAAKLAAAAQITAASSEILRIEKETSAVILERKTALDELARKQAEANTLASKAREEQEAARKRMVELQTTLGLQEATELKPYKGPLISPESIREAEAQIAKIKSDLEKATAGTAAAIAAANTSSYSGSVQRRGGNAEDELSRLATKNERVREAPSGGKEFLAPTSSWTAEQEKARLAFINAAKDLATRASDKLGKLEKGQVDSPSAAAIKEVASGKVADPREIIKKLSTMVRNSVNLAEAAEDLVDLEKEVQQAKDDTDAAFRVLQGMANKGMKRSDPKVVEAQGEFQGQASRYTNAGVDLNRRSAARDKMPGSDIPADIARELAKLIASSTPEIRSAGPVAWKGEKQLEAEASRARETLSSPEVTELRNKIAALEGEIKRATGRAGEYVTPVRSGGQPLSGGRPVRDPLGRSSEELRASLASVSGERDGAAQRAASLSSSAAGVEKLTAAARSAYISAQAEAKKKISEAVSSVIGEVDMEGMVSDVVRDIADQMVKEFISSGAKTEKEIADFREKILATGAPINSGAKPSATASGNQRKGASVTSLREGDVAETPVTGAAQIAAREVASEILKQSPAIRAISSMQGREEIDAQIQADTARRRSSGVSGGSAIPSDLTKIGSVAIQRGVSKQHVDTLEKELTLLQAIEDKDDDVIARTKEISDELNQIRKGDGVSTAQDSGVIGQILKALNVSRDTAIGGESSRMGSFPSPFPLATVGSLFTSRGRKQAVDESDPEGLGNPIERALTVRREKTGARGREAIIAQAGAADLGDFAEMVDGTVTGIQGIFARISRNFSKGDKVDPETISALKEQIIGLMAIMKTVQELQIDKSIPKGEQAGLQKLKEAVGVLGSGGGGVSAALTALTKGSLTNASTESIMGKSPEERQAVNADLAKHVLVDLIPNLDRLNDVVRAMLEITPQKTPGSGQALIPGMPMGEFGAAANRSTVASIADTVASGSPDQITAVIAEALARNILDEDALRSLAPGESGRGGKAATKEFQQFDSGDGKFDLGTAEQRVKFAEVIQNFPSVMEVLASFPALSQLIGYDPALLEKLATEEEVARADIAALKERLEGFKRAVPKMAGGAEQIKPYSFEGAPSSGSDVGSGVPTELFRPVTSTAGMSPQQKRSISPMMIPVEHLQEWRGPGAGRGGDVKDRQNFDTSEAEAVADSVIAFLIRKGYHISAIDKDQDPQRSKLVRDGVVDGKRGLSVAIPPKTTITVVHKTEELKDDPAALSAVGELLKVLQVVPTANRGLTVATTSSQSDMPDYTPGFSMVSRGFQSEVPGSPYETYGNIQVAERDRSGVPMPGFGAVASHEGSHMAVLGGTRGAVGMGSDIKEVHAAIADMIGGMVRALEDTSRTLDPEIAEDMAAVVNDFFGNMGSKNTGDLQRDLDREVGEYVANVMAQMSGHTSGAGRSIAPRTGTYSAASVKLVRDSFSTGEQPGITSSTGSEPMLDEKLYAEFLANPGLTRRLRLGEEGKVQITDEEPREGYTVGGAQLENPRSGLLNAKKGDIGDVGDFRSALALMMRENEGAIKEKILNGVDMWIGMYDLPLTSKGDLGNKNAPSISGTAFDVTDLVPTGEKDRAIDLGKSRGQDSIGGYQGGSWSDDMFIKLREEGDRQAVTMSRGRNGSFSRVPGTSSTDMPGNKTYGFGDSYDDSFKKVAGQESLGGFTEKDQEILNRIDTALKMSSAKIQSLQDQVDAAWEAIDNELTDEETRGSLSKTTQDLDAQINDLLGSEDKLQDRRQELLVKRKISADKADEFQYSVRRESLENAVVNNGPGIADFVGSIGGGLSPAGMARPGESSISRPQEALNAGIPQEIVDYILEYQKSLAANQGVPELDDRLINQIVIEVLSSIMPELESGVMPQVAHNLNGETSTTVFPIERIRKNILLMQAKLKADRGIIYGFGDGRENKDDNIDDLDFSDFLETAATEVVGQVASGAPVKANKKTAPEPSKEEYDAQVAEGNLARKERLAAIRKAREAAKKAAKAAEAEAVALELAAAESNRVAKIENEAVQQSQEKQSEAPVQASTPAGPPAPPAKPPAPPTPPAGPPPPPAGPPSGGANDIDILVNQAIAKLGLGTSLPTLNEAILKLSAIVEQAVNARYESGVAGGVSMDKGALQDEIVNSNIGGIGDLAKFLDGLLSISETIRSQGGLPAVDIGGKSTQVASASAAIAGATYIPDGMKKQELLKIAQELNDLGTEVVLLIQMARQGKLKIEQEVQSASASAGKEMDGLTARRVTVEERRNSAQQGSAPDDWRDTRAQVPDTNSISRGIEDLAKLQGRYSDLGPVVLHARNAQNQFGKSLEDSVGKADRASDALRRLTDTNVGILKTVRTQVGRAATFLVLQQMGREIGGIIQHLQSGVFHFNQVLENTQVGFNTLFANTLQARASVGGELIPKLNEAGKMIGFMREESVKFSNALSFTAGAAAGMVAEIRQIANVTPFRFQPLVEAALKMKAFGFEATEIPGMINSISNAVAALGGEDEKIDRIAYALGQMNSAGRVYQNDMMQLANAGIAGYRMLSEKMLMDLTAMKNRSLGLMKDLPEETVKEFDRLQNLLNSASFKKSFGNIDQMIETLGDPKRAEGLIRNLAKRGFLIGSTAARAITAGMDKQYQGSADRLSRTMTGALSTIADLSQNFMATAFQPLFNSVRDTIVEVGQFMLKSSEITKTVDGVRKNMQAFITSLASFGPALETAGKIFVDVFVSGLGSAAEKGTALGAIMTTIVDKTGPGLKLIGEILQNDVGKGLTVATLAFTVFSRAITANPMIASIVLLIAAISGIAAAIEENTALSLFVGSFVNTFIPSIEQLLEVIGEAITTVMKNFSTGGLWGFIMGLSVAVDILMPMLTLFLTVMAAIAKVLSFVAGPLGFVVGIFVALKAAMMAFDLAGTVIGKVMGSIGGVWNSVNQSIDNQISKVKETAKAYEELRKSKELADDYKKNSQGEYLDANGTVVTDRSKAAMNFGPGEKVNSYGMTEMKGTLGSRLLGRATAIENGKQQTMDYLQNSRGIRPDFGGGFSLTHDDRQLGHTNPIITNNSIDRTYGKIQSADQNLAAFSSGKNLSALSPEDADKYAELKKASEIKQQLSAVGMFRFSGLDMGKQDTEGVNSQAGAYSMDNLKSAILVQKETSWILNRTFTQLEEAGKQIVAMQEQIAKIKAQMLSGEIGEDEGLDRISGIRGQIDTITAGQSGNMKIVGGLAESGIPGLKDQLEVADFGKRAIQIPPDMAAGIKEMPLDIQNIVMAEIATKYAKGEVFQTKEEQEQFYKGVLGEGRGKELMKASTIGLLATVGNKLGAGLRKLVGALPGQMTTYNRGGGSSGMREMDSRDGQHYYVDEQSGMLSNERVSPEELERRKTIKGGGMLSRVTSRFSNGIGIAAAGAGLAFGASRLAGQIAPIMAAPIIGPLMNLLPAEFTNVFREKAGPFQAMAAGIGTTAGSILGQALIPIPGVGAALGGMIGGALGELVGNAVDKAIDGTKAAMELKKATMDEAKFLGFTEEQAALMASERNKAQGLDSEGNFIVPDPGADIGPALPDEKLNQMAEDEYRSRYAEIQANFETLRAELITRGNDPKMAYEQRDKQIGELDKERNNRNAATIFEKVQQSFNDLAPLPELAKLIYGEEVVGAKKRLFDWNQIHADEVALIEGRIAQGYELTDSEKKLREEFDTLTIAAATDPFGLQGTFMDVPMMGGPGQMAALDAALKRGGEYTAEDVKNKVTNAAGELVKEGDKKSTIALRQIMKDAQVMAMASAAGFGEQVAEALLAGGIDLSKITAETSNEEVLKLFRETLSPLVEARKRAEELTPRVDMRKTRRDLMDEFGNEAGYKLFDDYSPKRKDYLKENREYKNMGGDTRLASLQTYANMTIEGGKVTRAITPQVPRDQIGGQDAGQTETIDLFTELNLLTSTQKLELEALKEKEEALNKARYPILELSVKYRKVHSQNLAEAEKGMAAEKAFAQFQMENLTKLAAANAAGQNASKEQIALLKEEEKLNREIFTIGKQKMDVGLALQAAEAAGLVITNKDIASNKVIRDFLIERSALIKTMGSNEMQRVNVMMLEAQLQAKIAKLAEAQTNYEDYRNQKAVLHAAMMAKIAAMPEANRAAAYDNYAKGQIAGDPKMSTLYATVNKLKREAEALVKAAIIAGPTHLLASEIENLRKQLAKDAGAILGGDGAKKDKVALEKNISLLNKMGNVAQQTFDRMRKAQKRAHDEYIEQLDEQEKRINDRYKDRSDQQTEENLQAQLQIAGLQMRSSSADPLEAAKSFYDAKQALEEFYINQQRDAELKVVSDEKERYQKQYADSESAAQEIYDAAMKRLNARFEFADKIMTSDATTSAQVNNALRMTMVGVTGQNDSPILGGGGGAGSGGDGTTDDGLAADDPNLTAAEKRLKASQRYNDVWGPSGTRSAEYKKAIAVKMADRTAAQQKTVATRDAALARMIAEQNYNKAREQDPTIDSEIAAPEMLEQYGAGDPRAQRKEFQEYKDFVLTDGRFVGQTRAARYKILVAKQNKSVNELALVARYQKEAAEAKAEAASAAAAVAQGKLDIAPVTAADAAVDAATTTGAYVDIVDPNVTLSKFIEEYGDQVLAANAAGTEATAEQEEMMMRLMELRADATAFERDEFTRALGKIQYGISYEPGTNQTYQSQGAVSGLKIDDRAMTAAEMKVFRGTTEESGLTATFMNEDLMQRLSYKDEVGKNYQGSEILDYVGGLVDDVGLAKLNANQKKLYDFVRTLASTKNTFNAAQKIAILAQRTIEQGLKDFEGTTGVDINVANLAEADITDKQFTDYFAALGTTFENNAERDNAIQRMRDTLRDTYGQALLSMDVREYSRFADSKDPRIGQFSNAIDSLKDVISQVKGVMGTDAANLTTLDKLLFGLNYDPTAPISGIDFGKEQINSVTAAMESTRDAFESSMTSIKAYAEELGGPIGSFHQQTVEGASSVADAMSSTSVAFSTAASQANLYADALSRLSGVTGILTVPTATAPAASPASPLASASSATMGAQMWMGIPEQAPDGRMYTGGTPYFDESTGLYTDGRTQPEEAKSYIPTSPLPEAIMQAPSSPLKEGGMWMGIPEKDWGNQMYPGGSKDFDETTGMPKENPVVGDGRVYAGGTPDFDERTGEYTDGRGDKRMDQRMIVSMIIRSIAIEIADYLKLGIPGTGIDPQFPGMIPPPFKDDGRMRHMGSMGGSMDGDVENVFNITVNNASGMDARQLAGELARLIAQQAGSTVN